MTDAIAATGTLLQMGDGAPTEAFATIAEVRDISGPGLSLNAIDVTAHTPEGWHEFIGGLLDGGEVTFDINWVPSDATHDVTTGLVANMLARSVDNYQLVLPDAANTTWRFAALVTGFEPSEPVDDALTASVTLRITGQPTLGVV